MTATAARTRWAVEGEHLAPEHHDGASGSGSDGPAQAALNGAVAAAAMTGARAFTVSMGLVDETPPHAIVDKTRLMRHVPRKQRGAAIELLHWSYGAQGGAMYGLLPASVRSRAWSGPAFGVVLWLGFELVLAPALRLEHARRVALGERIAFLADHALYGYVLHQMGKGARR